MPYASELFGEEDNRVIESVDKRPNRLSRGESGSIPKRDVYAYRYTFT